MFGMGTGEMILVGVMILVLFGANKIPEFARGLGKGIREFKDAANDVKRDIEREVNVPTQNQNYQAPHQESTPYKAPQEPTKTL